jgi:hypothetical protein
VWVFVFSMVLLEYRSGGFVTVNFPVWSYVMLFLYLIV